MRQKSFALKEKNFADLNPLLAGFEKCGSGYTFGPNIREYYLIHYINSGIGYFYSNNMKYTVNVGEAFLIKPNEITTYSADKENPWEYIWIGFNGNLAKAFEEIKIPVFKINSDVFLKILQVETIQSCKEEYLAGKLFEIYAEIFDEKQNLDYAQIIENYINTNYMKKIKIADLSKLVNLDKRYLSRVFKTKTGKTMQGFLMEKRMIQAKTLLESGYDVKTTANMVGYDDVFVFSKAFKRIYLNSPNNFKTKAL